MYFFCLHYPCEQTELFSCPLFCMYQTDWYIVREITPKPECPCHIKLLSLPTSHPLVLKSVTSLKCFLNMIPENSTTLKKNCILFIFFYFTAKFPWYFIYYNLTFFAIINNMGEKTQLWEPASWSALKYHCLTVTEVKLNQVGVDLWKLLLDY